MIRTGTRVSEYVLLHKIGEGGFGEVWKARHHATGDYVAVKIPTDREYVEQLRREGAIQRVLRHPHIVQTLGLDPAADPPYFVMEYVEGRSLRQLLQQRGSLSLQESVDIAQQVLDALGYAHSQGVIHRDIKPGNILVAPGGEGMRYQVKVTDFGLGHVSETLAASLWVSGRRKTSEGRLLAGTVDYMSPEQKKGAVPSAAADLYSFGLVLYEMVTGELPVGAFRLPSEIYPDIPTALDDFLRRALAPSPANRYADGGEAMEAFSKMTPTDSAPHGGGGEPFVLSTGAEAFTLRELVHRFQEQPGDGKHHLYAGNVSPWLRTIREPELARRAEEIRRKEADRDVGLQMFLEATGMVAPPKLEVETPELHLGTVPRGRNRTFRIDLTARDGGFLWGEARVEGSPCWIRPERVHFKGARSRAEFTLAGEEVATTDPQEIIVVLETNGGIARVSVRFQIGRRPATLLCPVRVVEIPVSGRGTGSTLLRVGNAGEEPLTLTIRGDREWLRVDRPRAIPPGGEEEIRVTVLPEGKAANGRVGSIIVESSGGSAVVQVRVNPIPSFNLLSFILGLVSGVVPGVAELLFLYLILALFLQRRDREDAADAPSFLLGLLPGLAWHAHYFFYNLV